MAEGDVLFVDVVAADRRVWEGEALSVIVRTFTGPELSRALGVWSALGGAGAALGRTTSAPRPCSVLG